MIPTARNIFLSATTPREEDEKRFFSAIRTRTGVFKTTSAARMRDLNMLLASHCEERSISSFTLLDVAASSGVSTVDLFNDLAERGITARVTATDILIDGKIVRVAPGYHALLDKSGRVLQHDIIGIAVRPYYSRNPAHNLATALANALHRALSLAGAPTLVEEVKLVSQAGTGVSFLEDDLFEDNPQLNGQFDVIRAANVLNRSYFDSDLIERAIVNLTRKLKGEGSVLVVNRTLENGSNHGSLFELTKTGQYIVLGRLGHGSEVEDIVVSVK